MKGLAAPFGVDQLRRELGWWRRCLQRALLASYSELQEYQALAAYEGLVRQAWAQRPLRPEVVPSLWVSGGFLDVDNLPAFFNPSRREREGSSHHYGHDIQLKRHAGMPLVGRPLPFLLEHGLKVSRCADFESAQRWAVGGYICMGKKRARWLRERHGTKAHAIGPWILYARPLLSQEALEILSHQLGRSLLVVLAHSWDRVERRMDFQACISAIKAIAEQQGYHTVIWLRHWQDPSITPLPSNWILACNGHRSNPWFLDSMRTLLELCAGVATNAFGTHLGYAVALDRPLHWLDIAADQDLSALNPAQAEQENLEWLERQRLSKQLAELLQEESSNTTAHGSQVRQFLNPYWGFDCYQSSTELRQLLLAKFE